MLLGCGGPPATRPWPELIENGRAGAETLGMARGTVRFEGLHERLETAATG